MNLAIVFVVDARDLLVAGCHDAEFARRAAMPIVDDAGGTDAELFEIGAEAHGRFVLAHQSDDAYVPAERRDIVRDVGGAAQTVIFVIEPHDRYRGFRRNTIDHADHEVIEHQVADDKDGAAGKARREVRGRRHATGCADAGAGGAPRSAA